jgi:putative GTP pyrophosphokinase
MSKKLAEDEIVLEYSELAHNLTTFNDELIRQVEKLLGKVNITLGFPILGRIKSLDSVLSKQNSGIFTIRKTIKELQDLAGFRIILLFSRDVDLVLDILKTNLDVIKLYNAQDKLGNDQFGYSSTHCIVKVPKTWLEVPMFKDFGDFLCEIQIRTLSQHTWAASSHLLEYKETEEIPKNLKRSISRVSALLETVDLEFERLLNEKTLYKESKIIACEKHIADQTLTEENLETILNEQLPKLNKKGNEDYSSLLNNLSKINITTLDQLSELIRNYIEKAIHFEKVICEEILKSNNNEDFILYNDTKYPKSKLDKSELGYSFYNQVGLLTLILKLKKESQQII